MIAVTAVEVVCLACCCCCCFCWLFFCFFFFIHCDTHTHAESHLYSVLMQPFYSSHMRRTVCPCRQCPWHIHADIRTVRRVCVHRAVVFSGRNLQLFRIDFGTMTMFSNLFFLWVELRSVSVYSSRYQSLSTHANTQQMQFSLWCAQFVRRVDACALVSGSSTV